MPEASSLNLILQLTQLSTLTVAPKLIKHVAGLRDVYVRCPFGEQLCPAAVASIHVCEA